MVVVWTILRQLFIRWSTNLRGATTSDRVIFALSFENTSRACATRSCLLRPQPKMKTWNGGIALCYATLELDPKVKNSSATQMRSMRRWNTRSVVCLRAPRVAGS